MSGTCARCYKGDSESRLSAVSIAGEEPSPVSSTLLEAGTEPLLELTDYLGNLGLGDNYLAKVISLLLATQGGAAPQLEEAEPPAEPVEKARTPLVAGRADRASSVIEKRLLDYTWPKNNNF